jgi:hypothetical protein
MPESYLPIVSSRPLPERAPAPSKKATGRWAGALLTLAVGLLVVLGLAALVGEDVRNAVLVEVDRGLAGSEVSYSDAPAEAALFFAERDSVTIRVPWEMTAGEFLALYHLETNASARGALRDQLGVSSDTDPLRAGDRVTLALTLTRPEG